MKRARNNVIAILVVIAACWYLIAHYSAPSAVAPQIPADTLTQSYASTTAGFSLRLPQGYVADGSYQYHLNPQTVFSGVKFTIPAARADGTNLGHDTYVSMEKGPQTSVCSADLFLDGVHGATTLVQNGISYSVASSSGAGAGNRYEETVYAVPGTNSCRAMRYFVHYSNYQNYEPGAVVEFDKQALLDEFDAIRATLILDK